MKLFGEMAKQKSIEIELNMSGSSIFFTDRKLLENICRNLVSNAIKFTREGGKIIIPARSIKESGKLEFGISDTGLGIL
jgi:signal transduction histidine kinase